VEKQLSQADFFFRRGNYRQFGDKFLPTQGHCVAAEWSKKWGDNFLV
jgi:hypothetical protein